MKIIVLEIPAVCELNNSQVSWLIICRVDVKITDWGKRAINPETLDTPTSDTPT